MRYESKAGPETPQHPEQRQRKTSEKMKEEELVRWKKKQEYLSLNPKEERVLKGRSRRECVSLNNMRMEM